MNPNNVTKTINDLIVEQMHYALPVERALAECKGFEPFLQRFKDVVDNYHYASSPYLERIPFYKQDNDSSLGSMADRNIILSETADLFAKYFGCTPDKARLYKHQVASAQAVKDGKNLIVCTGTGSGKTESFLIPVLNAIIKERKEKGDAYEPGVRALLLYPMNALVNDQLKRIRSILKGAEAACIPYAKDITYGIYTGDVATLRQERNEQANLIQPDQDLIKALKDANSEAEAAGIQLRHQYLSDDDISSNEYTTRSRWDDGAADILITNYSMLEQMLLNPWRNALFAGGTWKFIVLDEAHSYDGAMGTEIAWLLRRLQYRVLVENSKGDENQKIQYIATSATLFEPDVKIQDKEQRTKAVEERIRTEFAEKLFPSPKGTAVSILMGETYIPHFEEGQSEPDFTYLNKKESEADLSHIELDSKWAWSGKCGSGLISQTAWLLEMSSFLEKMKKAFSVNIGETPIAMGDAIAQIFPAAQLGFKGDFGWKNWDESRRAMSSLVQKAVAMNDKKIRVKIDNFIRDISGETNKLERQRLKGVLTAFLSDENTRLSSREFIYLAQYVSFCSGLYKFGADEQGNGADEPNAMGWSVQWDEASARTFANMKPFIDVLSNNIEKCASSIRKKWLEICEVEEDTDIRMMITRYLLKTKALHCLETVLDDLEEKPKERTLENIAARVFSDKDSQSAQQQLVTLVQLLSMSRLPELSQKPLIDLRYHQLASGLTSLAVAFKRTENGKIDVIVREDDERICDSDGNLLFAMGACYDCAHPYLLFYTSRACLSDYGDDQCTCCRYPYESNRYRHAVSWISNPHAEIGENNQKMWLNFRTGVLYFQTMPEDDPEHLIEVFHAYDWPYAENEKKIKQTPCPVCEARSKSLGLHDSIISDYKTSDETLRSILIESLISNSDISSSSAHKVGSGRKLLAFSDSRSRAARLATEFDTYSTGRLLEYNIWKVLSETENSKPSCFKMRLAQVVQEMQQEGQINFFGNREGGYWGNGTLRAAMEQPDDKVVYTIFNGSVLALGAMLYGKLKESKATNLLSFEDDAGRLYSEVDASILLAMSYLKKSGRNSLIKRRNLRVSSLAIELLNNDEKEYLANYGNDIEDLWRKFSNIVEAYENPLSVIQRVLADLFGRTKLFTDGITEDSRGYNSREDTSEALPIYAYSSNSWLRRINLKSNNPSNDVVYLINRVSRLCSHEDNEDYACKLSEALFAFMQSAHILVPDPVGDFRLNLSELRFYSVHNNSPLKRTGDYFRIEEHTAQLNTARARLYQHMFTNGDINILSCSTTFEMGVDLGDLNCVFMANMPPSVANYRQRAGRAGRRPGAAAYVLSCIASNSHDRHHKDCPEELFFGKVKEPVLYLENKTYRARHLRAIALHQFLCYLKEHHNNQFLPNCWDRMHCFMGGRAPYARYMKEWVEKEEKREEVDKMCERIAQNKLAYSVAADLCYQVVGSESIGQLEIEIANSFYLEQLAGLNEQLCLELGGPHLPTKSVSYWKSCMVKRFLMMEAGRWQTVPMELARARVLPRYGFPCDVAELRLNQNEQEKNVELSRDLRLAIFEYAPGKTVFADKRLYKSVQPLPEQEGNEDELKHLYKCPNCRCRFFFPDDRLPNQCPECQSDWTQINRDDARVSAIWPHGFRAARSKNPRKYVPFIVQQRQYAYTGGIGDSWHPKNFDMEVCRSVQRQILFCNPDVKYEIGGEERTRDLIHFVHTDIVLLTVDDRKVCREWQDVNRIRIQNAWNSAMQAILKAMSHVLQVNPRDLDGLLHVANDKRYMVIFDNTPSGSGTLQPLLHVEQSDHEDETNAWNDRADELIEKIIKEALRICGATIPDAAAEASQAPTACGCYRQAEDFSDCRPVPHFDYLQAKDADQGAKVREYCSCYKCLKSYDNQRLHGILDVHDAAEVLYAMLRKESHDECEESTARKSQTHLQPTCQSQMAADTERIARTLGAIAPPRDELIRKLREGKKINVLVNHHGRSEEMRIVGRLSEDTVKALCKSDSAVYQINVKDIIREK